MAGFELEPHLRPHWHVHTPYLSMLVHSSCNLVLKTQVHSNGHAHTNSYLRSHSPGVDVAGGGRRCCFSMNRLQSFAKGVRLHLRARTHAHGVNVRRHSLWVDGFCCHPRCGSYDLFYLCILKHRVVVGAVGGGGQRGTDERSLDPIIVMYSLTDIQLDSARQGPRGRRFLVQISSRICVSVVDAYAYQTITSIKASAYRVSFYFFLFCSARLFFFGPFLKDGRILNCVCSRGMESVFALSQPIDPEIMMVSESPSKGTVQWSRLPQEIKAPSSLS